jgi:hypothetical protein
MKRQTKQLSSSLEHRLSAYALATSAAGVGALALVQPVGAEIVYTPTHQVIKANSKYNLDLNNDGVSDFVITDNFGGQYFAASLSVGALEFRGDSCVQAHFFIGPSEVLAIHKGEEIGANEPFYACGMMAAANLLKSGTLASGYDWASVTDRYLGLRILINHERHYGWARLTVRTNRKTAAITATLTGYAYETIGNKHIIAGKTKGPDAISAEHGSLGALAAGASSLHTRSQR